AHIVEAVEAGDEVVPARGCGEAGGVGDFELCVCRASFGGATAGALDRWSVEGQADEGGLGERLGEEDRGGTGTTADIGDGGACAEPGGDAVEGGDPGI